MAADKSTVVVTGCWLYRGFGKNDWRLGFYPPGGKWITVRNYEAEKNAAARCHYLNGGN